MTTIVKLRLTGFALAIGSVAALISWAAYTTWQEVGHLDELFTSSQIASFEIADHLQATILRLNNILGDYALSTNGETLEQFWRDSDALNAWIDTQRSSGRAVISSAESNVIAQIDAGYDAYRETASNVIAGL